MAIGIKRAGLLGAFLACGRVSLPSAILMLVFALTSSGADISEAGWLQGLKLAAVAVVGLAVWSMGKTLAQGPIRSTLAIGSAIAASTIPGAARQLVPLFLCAIIGFLWLKPAVIDSAELKPEQPVITGDKLIPYKLAWTCLTIFTFLLVALPLIARYSSSPLWSIADSAYRAGSLVFGGGHAILPMLGQEVVGTGTGKISTETFQPVMERFRQCAVNFHVRCLYWRSNGVRLESYFMALSHWQRFSCLLFSCSPELCPFWQTLRRNRRAQAALMGINAAIVGILLAALYNPIWYDAVTSPRHFIIVLLVFLLLHIWKKQPWQSVLIAALAGWLIL